MALVVAISGTLACAERPKRPLRPNIVLIIGDDHGYPYAGFMGNEIVKTPNLDQLATGGVVFTHGFSTASNCRPSLRSLLTGLHPEQWRSLRDRQGNRGEPPQIRRIATLPRLLTEAGYQTFQAGKHWEMDFESAGFTEGTKQPFEQGDPRWGELGILANLAGGRGLELGRTTMVPLWDFLESRDSRRPFFVWFVPNLPHAPFNSSPLHQVAYRGAGLTKVSQDYYANVTWLDESIGKLTTRLGKMGLRRDTLIVYLSDNGWEQDPGQNTRDGPRGKLTLYELGFRTPVVFNWEGQLPKGVVRSDLVSAVDLMPTLLELAGVDVPERRHGVSLVGALLRNEPLPRQHVIGSVERMRAEPDIPASGAVPSRGAFVRTPVWRYLRFVEDGRRELYRIEEDPKEAHNVIAEHPDVAQGLERELDDWLGRMQTKHDPSEGLL